MANKTGVTGDHEHAAVNDVTQRETARAITNMPKEALRAAVERAVERVKAAEKKS